MKIWIDITNAPHVLFFRPVIAELNRLGHQTVVTARAYSQTIDLLNSFKIPYHRFGSHGGKNTAMKALSLAGRSLRLLPWAAAQRFDAAVSHGSNDMALVTWLLKLPSMFVHDYEHADLTYRFSARFVGKIVVPELIPDAPLLAHGAKREQLRRYPGLKEEISLCNVQVDGDYLKKLGIDTSKIVVVLRSPAEMSAYHRFENTLFYDIVDKLAQDPRLYLVVLTRDTQQRERLQRELAGKSALVPTQALDGPSLLYSSDLLIGAGGTMNRESVYLGTPVYTIFKGKMGAVDQHLIDSGQLGVVDTLDDLKKIPWVKKQAKRQLPGTRSAAFDAVLQEILTLGTVSRPAYQKSETSSEI